MTALEIKLAIGAAILAVSLAVLGVYHHHVLVEGEAKIEAADAKALSAAKAKADAETQLNLERAAKADAGAISAQKAVDDYRAAHPEQPLRLCYSNNSVPGLPKVGTGDLKIKNPTSGPTVIPEVPGRSEGPDIAPELDAIVQAAQRLDILYAQRQQR